MTTRPDSAAFPLPDAATAADRARSSSSAPVRVGRGGLGVPAGAAAPGLSPPARAGGWRTGDPGAGGRRPRWAAALLAAGVALVGGCQAGGAEGGPATAGGQTASGNTPSSSPLPGGPPQARDWMDRPELPLDRYGDLMVQADLAMFARAGADGGDWEVEQEDFIAACMKEAGFEYQPRAVAPLVEGESDIKAGVRRLSLPWLAEDLAQVERYGYGYSTAGEIVENAPLDDPAEPDPNAAYLASLSESARRAYDVAMVGSAHAAYIDSGLPDGVAAPEIGGCAGAARLAHPDAAAAVMSDAPSALYQGLLTQMYEMGWAYGASYLGRADLEALDAAWRECFERDVSLAPLDPSPAPGTGADPPPEPLGPSELDGPSAAWTLAYFWTDGGESWDPGPSGDNPAPAGYMSLTGTPREIAIAVADYKCRQETDYVATFLAIEGRAQEDFIAAHRAELDQMVAAAERYIGG